MTGIIHQLSKPYADNRHTPHAVSSLYASLCWPRLEQASQQAGWHWDYSTVVMWTATGAQYNAGTFFCCVECACQSGSVRVGILHSEVKEQSYQWSRAWCHQIIIIVTEHLCHLWLWLSMLNGTKWGMERLRGGKRRRERRRNSPCRNVLSNKIWQLPKSWHVWQLIPLRCADLRSIIP